MWYRYQEELHAKIRNAGVEQDILQQQEVSKRQSCMTETAGIKAAAEETQSRDRGKGKGAVKAA